MKKKLSAVFAALFVILCVAGAIPAMAANTNPSSNSRGWQTSLPGNGGNGTVIENGYKVTNHNRSHVSLESGTTQMLAWVMKNGTSRISDIVTVKRTYGWYDLNYWSAAGKGTNIVIRACSDTVFSPGTCRGNVDIQ